MGDYKLQPVCTYLDNHIKITFVWNVGVLRTQVSGPLYDNRKFPKITLVTALMANIPKTTQGGFHLFL